VEITKKAPMLHTMLWSTPIILMLVLFRWRWKTAWTQPHPNALLLIGAMEKLCDTQDHKKGPLECCP
jgi:hypothetical protein